MTFSTVAKRSNNAAPQSKGRRLLPGGRTPRTDTEAVRFGRIMVDWSEPGKQKTTELIPADFARQLEVSEAYWQKRAVKAELTLSTIDGIADENEQIRIQTVINEYFRSVDAQGERK